MNECSFIHLSRMYQIANLKNNRDLQARALYWDAWLKFETNTEETETLIEEALEKVDSVNYTYDHARIFFVKGMLWQNITNTHKLIAHLRDKKITLNP
ncbi:MAG: hypothetical protein V8Q76_02330 [Bacteroides intestinalis]